MPNSVVVGSRLRISTIFRYSLSVRLCCVRSSSDTIRLLATKHRCINHRFKYEFAVRAAKQVLTGSVRMRHHPEHVSLFTDDSGDIVQRSIGIRFGRDLAVRCDVPEYHLTVVFDALQRLRFSEKVSVAVSDWDAKQLTFPHEIGVRCLGRLRTQMKKLAHVLQSNIAKQRAGQQSSFRKDLEPITNAKDEATLSSKVGYGLHDRREFRQGARAQVITIRKSTGQDHGIESLQRRVLMPDEFNRLSNHGFDGVITIVFAIRARKNDDTKFHTLSVLCVCASRGLLGLRGCAVCICVIRAVRG